MNVAIIPARGGSKRIPRKNIKSFLGKPMIAYSIETALASGLFDRVLVSTDDEEIASVAQAHGAETPFLRPKELADEHTGTNAVAGHALAWLRESGKEYAHACCIYATAPFMTVADLQEAHRLLQESGKSFVFPVTTFPFPVQRAVRLTAQGEVEAIYPEYASTRSQDLEEAYHDVGQFYWGRTEAFLCGKALLTHDSLGLVIPRHRAQDIDTAEDWERAELMYEVLQARENRP